MMETVIVAGNLKTMINENEDQQNIMKLNPNNIAIIFKIVPRGKNKKLHIFAFLEI